MTELKWMPIHGFQAKKETHLNIRVVATTYPTIACYVAICFLSQETFILNIF